jgi:hypothetical protein
MAFFSWFKSKSGSSERNESEQEISAKGVAEPDPLRSAQNTPARQGIPHFRETLPHSSHAISRPSTFKRIARPTIDIPLLTLSQSLPEGLSRNNPSLDSKRRIQLPRQEVRVSDADHTGTVRLYVLHAVCPDIFAAPILANDNRSVRFPLPAWERLRNAEGVDIKPGSEPEKPSTEPHLEEKVDPIAQTIDDGNQKRIDEKLSNKDYSPSIANDEAPPTASKPIRADSGQSVRVALTPILRNLPPELSRAALHSAAGANTEIELPLGLIQPQLPNGQVTVPIPIFLRALPEPVRSAFGEADQSVQIPIPLKELFRLLPSDALPLRSDQETDEIRDPIDTPFTATAREEAEKFQQATGSPVGSETDHAQVEFSDSPQSDKVEAPSVGPESAVQTPPAKSEPDFSALQSVFLTEERLDLPTIAYKISALPGLQAALLHTADGRQLTGRFGDDQFERTALALFPVLFSEIKTRLDERECPGLETLTLSWQQEQVSIFSDGRLCLSVQHSRRPFKPGVREKLSLIFLRLTEALSTSEI